MGYRPITQAGAEYRELQRMTKRVRILAEGITSEAELQFIVAQAGPNHQAGVEALLRELTGLADPSQSPPRPQDS